MIFFFSLTNKIKTRNKVTIKEIKKIKKSPRNYAEIYVESFRRQNSLRDTRFI